MKKQIYFTGKYKELKLHVEQKTEEEDVIQDENILEEQLPEKEQSNKKRKLVITRDSTQKLQEKTEFNMVFLKPHQTAGL